MYEQRDTSVPRKHHVRPLITEIKATGVQPETYIEWSIALIHCFVLPIARPRHKFKYISFCKVAETTLN